MSAKGRTVKQHNNLDLNKTRTDLNLDHSSLYSAGLGPARALACLWLRSGEQEWSDAVCGPDEGRVLLSWLLLTQPSMQK